MKRKLRLLLLRLLALLARPLIRPRPDALTSVLYIKPDHLGDLLLATPVLAALRQRLPHARVTALVGPWSRMVLARNPDVDVLLTCPFPGFERRPKDEGRRTKDEGAPIFQALSSFVVRLSSLPHPYLLLIRYALLLRAGRYDLAIVGRDDHWWGAALALLSGVPCRVGYAVPECRPFLSLALPWNPRDHVTAQGLALVDAAGGPHPPTPSPAAAGEGEQAVHPVLNPLPAAAGEGEQAVHPVLNPLPAAAGEGEQAVHPVLNPLPAAAGEGKADGSGDRVNLLPSPIARGAGLGVRAIPARFDPSQDDITWANTWIAGQGLAGAPLVLLHPGTGGPAKLWLAERWAAVADALQAAGARLVLTGGPDELALVAKLAAHMQSAALVLAGQTSVGQLAALMRRAALVLGVDSGPLHLAAAQGVPTLHLYGPGDAGRFGPWGDSARHVVLRADLWCSPCGQFAACPRGLARPECMELISTTRVVDRAREMLTARVGPERVRG
jgi:ADP-heptose:LPS heptosyltransferase